MAPSFHLAPAVTKTVARGEGREGGFRTVTDTDDEGLRPTVWYGLLISF